MSAWLCHLSWQHAMELLFSGIVTFCISGIAFIEWRKGSPKRASKRRRKEYPKERGVPPQITRAFIKAFEDSKQ